MTGWSGKTIRFERPGEARVPENATYVIAASGTEDRAKAPFWDVTIRQSLNACCLVETQQSARIEVRVGDVLIEVPLRDSNAIRTLFGERQIVYIDISGLAHHVWAPILREALKSVKNVWIVYAEPDGYKPHPNPTSLATFDLSVAISGISPLPGFAKLRGPLDERDAIFVPLLGFEGTRARQVAMTLDPMPRVVPIVGVPGFRAEYPFVSIACNQEFLEDYKAHADVRLARASCPFSAFQALTEIRKDFPDSYMYLAPIGTKPHSVGAIWFSIMNPAFTEVMYDHPIRKAKRTQGIGTIHLYCLKDD